MPGEGGQVPGSGRRWQPAAASADSAAEMGRMCVCGTLSDLTFGARARTYRGAECRAFDCEHASSQRPAFLGSAAPADAATIECTRPELLAPITGLRPSHQPTRPTVRPRSLPVPRPASAIDVRGAPAADRTGHRWHVGRQFRYDRFRHYSFEQGCNSQFRRQFRPRAGAISLIGAGLTGLGVRGKIFRK